MKTKWSQIIIAGFLVFLFVLAAILDMDILKIINLSFVKFAMNGVLVLSLIPMINTGIGMNFGLPVGIVSGLIGMCIIVNMRLTGIFGFISACAVTTPIAVVFGYIYGIILNRVKGRED
nr:ABC transporter permease [Bacillota bacterium]